MNPSGEARLDVGKALLVNVHAAGNAELVVDSFHLRDRRSDANLLQALRRNLDGAELRFPAGRCDLQTWRG